MLINIQLFLIVFSFKIKSSLPFLQPIGPIPDLNQISSSSSLYALSCDSKFPNTGAACSTYYDCDSCLKAVEGDNFDCIWTGTYCCQTQYNLITSSYNISLYCTETELIISNALTTDVSRVIVDHHVPSFIIDAVGNREFAVRIHENGLESKIQGIVDKTDEGDTLFEVGCDFIAPLNENDPWIDSIQFSLDYILKTYNASVMIGLSSQSTSVPFYYDKIVPSKLLRGHPSHVKLYSNFNRNFSKSQMTMNSRTCSYIEENSFACLPTGYQGLDFASLTIIEITNQWIITSRLGASLHSLPEIIFLRPISAFPKMNMTLALFSSIPLNFYKPRITFNDVNNLSMVYSTSPSECENYDIQLLCPLPPLEIENLPQSYHQNGSAAMMISIETHGYPFSDEVTRNYNLTIEFRPDPNVINVQFMNSTVIVELTNFHGTYEYHIEFETSKDIQVCTSINHTVANASYSRIECVIDRMSTHQNINSVYLVIQGYRILIARGSGVTFTPLHLILFILIALMTLGMVLIMFRFYQKNKLFGAKKLTRFFSHESNVKSFYNEPRKAMTKRHFFQTVTKSKL